MSHTFKERVRIKPGGIIEIAHPHLPPGEEAEVTVTFGSDEISEVAPVTSPRRPIWEVAREIGSSVPDAEWAKVPKDLAENLDHYLYGTPKPEE
jgi:hypothetical protein